MFVKSAHWRRNSKFQVRCLCKETPAEKTRSVWQELHANKLGEKTVHEYSNDSVQFVNSFPFVDGNSSLFLQQEEDARREKVLSEMGLRVVRFGNEEVVKNLSAVVGKVRELVGIRAISS